MQTRRTKIFSPPVTIQIWGPAGMGSCRNVPITCFQLTFFRQMSKTSPCLGIFYLVITEYAYSTYQQLPITRGVTASISFHVKDIKSIAGYWNVRSRNLCTFNVENNSSLFASVTQLGCFYFQSILEHVGKRVNPLYCPFP